MADQPETAPVIKESLRTETAVRWGKHPTWKPGDPQPRLADGWDGVRITKDGSYEVLKHPERRDAEWWRMKCMEADQASGEIAQRVREFIHWVTHNEFTDPENMLVCAEWSNLCEAAGVPMAMAGSEYQR